MVSSRVADQENAVRRRDWPPREGVRMLEAGCSQSPAAKRVTSALAHTAWRGAWIAAGSIFRISLIAAIGRLAAAPVRLVDRSGGRGVDFDFDDRSLGS